MAMSKLPALGALPLAAQGAHLIASHFSGTLYSLELTDAGSLTVTGEFDSAARILAWIEYDRETSTVYVSDESWFGPNTGTIEQWAVGADAFLEKTGSTTTQGGDVHSGIYGGSDGKGFIALANYNGGSLSTYALPLTPGSQALQKFAYTMDGPGPVPDRQDAPHVHSAFADPTGDYVLGADLGADIIRIWTVSDASSGQLSECPGADTAPGDGPRHGTFAEIDGTQYLFVVNELANSVTTYTVSYPEGECLSLSAVSTASTFPDDVTPQQGAKAAEIRVKDNFVYASNRFDGTLSDSEDSLAVFSIDTATGDLALIQHARAHGYFPRTFEINEEGTLVAVGGQTSANVAIIERDADTGMLGNLVATVNVGEQGTVNGEDGLSAVVWV